MFRVQQLTHFGSPAAAAPKLGPALPTSAAWALSGGDPFFAEISPAAMGYRHVPRGFAAGSARRGERG
jgi:hypothetical protein